ncbi:hypothetical protein, unlikely [Trypanosoma congolense IL3000]|uniref:Uncharacterized protein n=1 Tax=Trypanosoma congolense (strain IL3000) TaxID=1068625 RepID=F9W438_TRYCI|nr:hypothetical protein, unlikely [Trypanosoma congolense IL3000]
MIAQLGNGSEHCNGKGLQQRRFCRHYTSETEARKSVGEAPSARRAPKGKEPEAYGRERLSDSGVTIGGRFTRYQRRMAGYLPQHFTCTRSFIGMRRSNTEAEQHLADTTDATPREVRKVVHATKPFRVLLGLPTVLIMWL